MKETLMNISFMASKVQGLSAAMRLAVNTLHESPDDSDMDGVLYVLDFVYEELDKVGVEIENTCTQAIRPLMEVEHADGL